MGLYLSYEYHYCNGLDFFFFLQYIKCVLQDVEIEGFHCILVTSFQGLVFPLYWCPHFIVSWNREISLYTTEVSSLQKVGIERWLE